MHIKHIHCMIEDLAEYGKCMVEAGVGNGEVNICQAGQIVDMIKDLADAEYHSLISKEMKEYKEEEEAEEKYMMRMLKEEHKDEYRRMRDEYGEDEGERRFYDNYRYKSSGRFAPKGSGSYMPRSSGRRRGYEEMPYMHMYPEMYGGMTPEEMRDMDLDMNRMYYSGGRPAPRMQRANSTSAGRSADIRGYEDGYRDGEMAGRSKMSNSRYDNARRGYSESKEMHKGNSKEDNEENLRNLEKILAVIDEDVKELMPNMTPSEKTMLKAKFSTWAQKVS